MTSWWQTFLIAVFPSALTCVVTIYISRNSQLNKNINTFKKNSRQLGLNDKKSLRIEMLEKINSLSNDIGRKDYPSLTKQHENMQSLLQKEIETAERRYAEEEKRLRDFTIEQHDMNNTINEFRLFMESWQRMVSNLNECEVKVKQLEVENIKLKQENRELHIKLNKNKQKHISEL